MEGGEVRRSGADFFLRVRGGMSGGYGKWRAAGPAWLSSPQDPPLTVHLAIHLLPKTDLTFFSHWALINRCPHFPGSFRVRGDVIDIYPSGAESAVRVELFGDEIESIKEINPVTGEITGIREHIAIYPASHYVTSPENMEKAIKTIDEELTERVQWFKDRGKLLEAQRVEQRTRYDLEMLREVGTCKGIENYSRHLNGLGAGTRPYTLIDYFPKDFLIMIDESHVMLPQLRAMYEGDRSRKSSLVDYGFRDRKSVV